MDPPSPQLVQRLTALGLCRPRDLRRCRRSVRRLARDLPAFESVWIDALVQQRRLTAFQAEVLMSPQPDSLLVGPLVLVEKAGGDAWLNHFRARPRQGGPHCLLTRTDREPQAPAALEERLRTLIERTASLRHPGLAPLQGFDVAGEGISIASPWVDGPSLHDLMVRRGRYAPAVVATIAQQLCDALAALESRNVMHGDLRLRNVRLSRKGQAVLIIPGLRATLWPELSLREDLPADWCDGVAPELIGTGAAPGTSSDIYAFGCLLWEMLAGRPPFPHGDPLAKLAAHQTHSVPSVLELAPGTPSALAALIADMTAREPSRRPTSWLDAGARLRSLRRCSRRRLRKWPDAAHSVVSDSASRTGTTSRAAAAMTACAALAGIAVLLFSSGARTELLSIAQRVPIGHTPAHETAGSPDSTLPEERPAPRLLPIPAADARGIIELTSVGPYQAGEIGATGTLVLRGEIDVRPVILIEDRPLRISAQRLILDNVELRRAPSGTTAHTGLVPPPLLEANSQDFGMRGCWLENGDETSSPAIQWTLLDSQAATARRAIVQQSVLTGGGPGLRINGPPALVECTNVLKHGSGPLLELAPLSSVRGEIVVRARHVTLRGKVGLVACRLQPEGQWRNPLELIIEESVFALDEAALIEFLGSAVPDDWQRLVRIGGEAGLVAPGTAIVGWRSGTGQLRRLPADRVTIDGLFSSALTFAGTADEGPQASAIQHHEGYGRSPRIPGIDPSELPMLRRESYNSAHDRTAARPSRADR